MSASGLVEDFFRHEYGRLVSTLAYRVGLEHIELVEDAVQGALMKALDSWTRAESPDDPSGWLYRVAYHEVIGQLRQSAHRSHLLGSMTDELAGAPARLVHPEPEEVQDDLLRMLFVCCDDAIPRQSQTALALKVLCGFEIREIAQRLFASEASVYKRLERARGVLRRRPPEWGALGDGRHAARVPVVHGVLYLLFTEGHQSSSPDEAIRVELCDEAIRLATLLAEHPVGQRPETFALLSLMHLHRARYQGRRSPIGDLLLLEEQDRDRWDRDQIGVGLRWLEASAEGDRFSRYHAEARIAAEHCRAPSLAETQWETVVECYELLERTSSSPLHLLNRAVAMAEWKGADHGLAIVQSFEPPSWLAGSYMWASVLADLHRRNGDTDEAERYRLTALATAPTPEVADLLRRRLDSPVRSLQ